MEFKAAAVVKRHNSQTALVEITRLSALFAYHTRIRERRKKSSPLITIKRVTMIIKNLVIGILISFHTIVRKINQRQASHTHSLSV